MFQRKTNLFDSDSLTHQIPFIQIDIINHKWNGRRINKVDKLAIVGRSAARTKFDSNINMMNGEVTNDRKSTRSEAIKRATYSTVWVSKGKVWRSIGTEKVPLYLCQWVIIPWGE